MRARVIRGTRNVFMLAPCEENAAAGKTEIEWSCSETEVSEQLQCRIKGKVLKGVEGYYNPLAPGDIVETDGSLITGLVSRRNAFARFNQKGQSPQLLAANIDYVACLTTAQMPPFRPRFIDRVLFQAEYSQIPAVIVLNKIDLADDDPETHERLEDYARIGYKVFCVSSKTGEGIKEFYDFFAGKVLALTGQSGVGKSSLLKALDPQLKIKTGALNEKYRRGNHTTTQPVFYEVYGEGGTSVSIIDTPGIRRFAPERVPAQDAALYMREFSALAGSCVFGASCSHESEEGCRIIDAVNSGAIHEDRYESFLRIKDEMSGIDKYPDYD